MTLGLAALAAATCLFAACSAATRYEVLSFFFDGVPLPGPEGEVLGPPLPELGPMSVEERARIQRERLGIVELTIHEPYRQDDCEACHFNTQNGSSRSGLSGWMPGLPQLRMPVSKLCVSCHQLPDRKHLHGPVAAARCTECHDPHKTKTPHLVSADSVNAVCARCHQGETFMTAEKHEEYGDESCSPCHDPHAADEPFLLGEEEPSMRGSVPIGDEGEKK